MTLPPRTLNEQLSAITDRLSVLERATSLRNASISGGDGLTIKEGGKLTIESGLLQLGGPEGGRGLMTVVNSAGETVMTLDADNAGFDALTVGDFDSPTVPSRGSSNTDIHLDPGLGSDDNPGTYDAPMSSMSAALDMLPDDLGGYRYRILVRAGSNIVGEGLTVRGVRNGELVITKWGTGTTWKVLGGGSPVVLQDCTATVEISDGDVNIGGAYSCLNISNCSYVYVSNMSLFGNNDCIYGISATQGATVTINDVQINGVTSGAVRASRASFMTLDDVSGVAGTWGVINNASIILGPGPIPSGPSGDVLTTEGGINAAWGTPTEPAPPPPPPPSAPPKTSTYAATWVRSWRDGRWRSTDRGMMQGSYGYGNHEGFATFDYNAIQTALNARTVTRIRIKLTRKSSGGSSGAGKPTFYQHRLTSDPGDGTRSSAPLGKSTPSPIGWGWGQSRWADLPLSWGVDFKNGITNGVAIYTSSGKPYLEFTTSVTLEITHEADESST